VPTEKNNNVNNISTTFVIRQILKRVEWTESNQQKVKPRARMRDMLPVLSSSNGCCNVVDWYYLSNHSLFQLFLQRN
jgi:hypothetical protein